MNKKDIDNIISIICPNDEDFEKPIISPAYLKNELEALALEQEPCEDAISRAEAVRVASGYCHPSNVAKELAKLPSVNPQPCEDAISRQAVEDAIYDAASSMDLNYGQIVEYIDKLPSVNPTKTGYWIEKDGKEQGYDIGGVKTWYIQIMCSECGFIKTAIEGHTGQYKYCPNCGAKMSER